MATTSREGSRGPETLPQPWGDGPIVLIDDDRLDLRIARRCHSLSGIERPLLTFADGEEAIGYVRHALASSDARAASVVVVDLIESRSPGLHGLEVLDRLHHVEQRLPVVIMTNSMMESFRRQATARGCAAYIQKPTRLAELAAVFAALGP